MQLPKGLNLAAGGLEVSLLTVSVHVYFESRRKINGCLRQITPPNPQPETHVWNCIVRLPKRAELATSPSHIKEVQLVQAKASDAQPNMLCTLMWVYPECQSDDTPHVHSSTHSVCTSPRQVDCPNRNWCHGSGSAWAEHEKCPIQQSTHQSGSSRTSAA